MAQTLKNFTPTRDWLLLPDPRVMEKSGIILDEKSYIMIPEHFCMGVFKK